MKHRHTRLFLLPAILLLLCIGFSSCSGKDFSANDVGNRAPEITEDGNMGLLGKEENAVVPNDPERKIIKTYYLSTETKGYEAAIQSLHELIEQNGGYVQESSSNNKSYNNTSNRYSRSASYVLRVPAENADQFVNTVGGILNVTGNRATVEDVSETYYSIEATLEELSDYALEKKVTTNPASGRQEYLQTIVNQILF